MLPLVRIGRVLSLLVCFSPLIWIVGGGILLNRLNADSSGFGFAVTFFGIPFIVAAIVYYFLVHKPIVRAYDELRAQPQKPLSTRTIVSLVIMGILLFHMVFFMGHGAAQELRDAAWAAQSHLEHCQQFPDYGDCREVLAR